MSPWCRSVQATPWSSPSCLKIPSASSYRARAATMSPCSLRMLARLLSARACSRLSPRSIQISADLLEHPASLGDVALVLERDRDRVHRDPHALPIAQLPVDLQRLVEQRHLAAVVALACRQRASREQRLGPQRRSSLRRRAAPAGPTAGGGLRRTARAAPSSAAAPTPGGGPTRHSPCESASRAPPAGCRDRDRADRSRSADPAPSIALAASSASTR